MRIAGLATLTALAVLALGQPALAQQTVRPGSLAVVAPERVLAVDPADRTLGRDDAPVTLTAYLSTVCGHCATWHEADFPEIKRRLIDTGQVRVVWRDLPTSPPQLALAGAVLARCAAPEHYDDALGALFRGQATYLQSGNVDGWLIAAATAADLPLDQAQACVSDDARYAEIETRARQASSLGVRSTPTLFVDGVVTSARTADEIEAAIAGRPRPAPPSAD
ncbi:MAG: thioredoxin domain-containing protein [Brevundimonas sp.]|uniref:DsbA family protein n=1 Tax=Brevundimonas sp. TaxID=1871086 RepID=UPI002768DB03|nr:thioredoxin domain-containing protein [Brevundimonas sp.]MDP3400569.1 thioredoxin domain-containing protein [Brevundimonas sp.]MDZ4108502.1 thioredoxin domain-containing protein [Brevundimonas sp.]